jgi:hypothetical protein
MGGRFISEEKMNHGGTENTEARSKVGATISDYREGAKTRRKQSKKYLVRVSRLRVFFINERSPSGAPP